MENPYTIFITAQAITRDLGDESGRQFALARLRRARVRRVVLEGYRSGLCVAESLLRDLREFFQGHGYDVLGGLMPVYGKGFGKYSEGVEVRNEFSFFCYSAEETVGGLEQEIRKLSRLFNQVVIDDAFLTPCRCAKCESGRGERDRPTFRRELLCEVAQRWRRAAHDENPSVRFTVKFPQYYDRYHLFGYDVARFTEIFDAVWVGTETRDPGTLDFGYVEPYQGYFNARWMRACAGAKFEAAWYDFYDCDEQLFYEQGVTTALGGPEDIVLFCYDEALMDSNKMTRLSQGTPGIERLRESAARPEGVFVVKPPNSEGGHDLFIFDYLGMLGVPCVPVTSLAPGMRSVIVPTHGLEDPCCAELIPQILAAGGQVILTLGALVRLAAYPELVASFGYRTANVARARAALRWIELQGNRYELAEAFPVPGDLYPHDADIPVTGYFEGFGGKLGAVPLVTVKNHPGGGRAVVWNLETFDHEDYVISEQLNVPVRSPLFHLPKEVIDFLRNLALAPLGFSINAPARVASFLFERHVVFVNYGTAIGEVEVKGLAWDDSTLHADSPDTTFSDGRLVVAPRSYACLER
ncbi:MAG: hypothetical protein HY706_02155 [Candidatus Hydrogenedentes bacterium]|nr:hypothetical protein [Candidatus Hydrogenedentota bacterium]